MPLYRTVAVKRPAADQKVIAAFLDPKRNPTFQGTEGGKGDVSWVCAACGDRIVGDVQPTAFKGRFIVECFVCHTCSRIDAPPRLKDLIRPS